MITRTERERVRRAKVALDAWDRYETLSDRSRMLAVVDALDLLDNEDEAAFNAAPEGLYDRVNKHQVATGAVYPEFDPEKHVMEVETTERKPPLNDHGIGAFVEKHTKKPPHPAVQAQFEGKPLQDPPGTRLEARKLPPYVHQLDEANGAEIQDWTWFKGCLTGILIAVAFYGAAWWGMTYYD